MKQDLTHDGDHHDDVRHRKPRHIAEKLESYMGIGVMIVGAGLLAILVFAFMQTGSGEVPAYMR